MPVNLCFYICLERNLPPFFDERQAIIKRLQFFRLGGVRNCQLVTGLKNKVATTATVCLHGLKTKDLWFIQSRRTCSAQWSPSQATERRHKACVCPRHGAQAATWNCFQTHSPDHRSGSSHSDRGNLSRHSSLSVSTMTHLCSGSSPPSPCCL